VRRALTLPAVVLVALGLVAGPALVGAAVQGSPDLAVTLPDDTVVAGETATLDLQLSNAGDLTIASANPALNERVTTARAVRVTVEDGRAPVEVRTGQQAVGSLATGAVGTAPVRVSVPEDAEPGTYELPVRVVYRHTRFLDEESGIIDERRVVRRFTVTVEVVQQARFAVVDATTDVRPGTTGRLNVTVENVGGEAARDATVALAPLSADLGFGGAERVASHVGGLAPGERRTLSYAVTAAPGATRQPYAFEATATFENGRGERVTDGPLALSATPGAGPSFVAVRTRSDLVAGSDGTATVALRNAGPVALRDATVTLRSASGAITVDGGTAGSRYVGDWAPGETRELTFDLAAAPGAGTRPYGLEAVIAFETDGDDTAREQRLPVAVTPARGASLAVTATASALRVGERGRLVATVTNDGDRPARDVAVTLEPSAPGVRAVEPSVAVGDLAPGASTEATFEVAVADGAEPGTRPFVVSPSYTDEDGDRRSADPATFGRRVAPERDRLRFEAVNATFAPDSDNRLVVRATNVGNETLTELSARLRPAPPFTSEGPGSYVARLEPGETADLAFQVTVAEDAVASTHALRLNATAELDGRPVTVGPEPVAVTVAEPERAAGDTTLFAVAAVVALLVLGAGWYWLRR
jgi:hypothetical protein